MELDFDSFLLVSGFTPINQRISSSNDCEVAAPIKPAATISSPGQKRNSVNSSDIKSDSSEPAYKKPRPCNTKPVAQHASNTTQDISKTSVTRKPGSFTKDPTVPDSKGVVKQSSTERSSSNHQLNHAGLGQAYQKAYERGGANSSSRSDCQPANFPDFFDDAEAHIHDFEICDFSSDDDIFDSLIDEGFDKIADFARASTDQKSPASAGLAAEEAFDDDDLDAELLKVEFSVPEQSHGESPPFTQRTPPVPRLQITPPTPSKSSARQQLPQSLPSATDTTALMPPTPSTSSARQQLPPSLPSATNPTALTPPKSPLAEKSPNVQKRNAPSENSSLNPFTRSPFPSPLLSRKAVPGLSPELRLRICFRIGEALTCHSNDTIVELYCRVRHSHREEANSSHKQVFEFCDLFHPDSPPFLAGQYAIWKDTPLWDYDARQFLLDENGGGEKKMARVVGRIENADRGAQMNVLSIWAADWDDVHVVRRVVSA
ncbi:MAG: hypothetical protein Q9191_004241 [Dirinaria sp. TL-2023a]